MRVVSATGSLLTTPAGGLLIIGNVFLDQLGIPIPAVPVLMVAGASLGLHPWWGVAVLTGSIMAVVLADGLWFVVGRVQGSRVTRLLCRISVTPDSCVGDTHRRFERWGSKAIVFAKFVPGFGIAAPPLAGALRMPSRRFVALTVIAASLWIGVHALTGFLFRDQIEWGLARVQTLAVPLAAGAGGIFMAYLAFRWWRRRRGRDTLGAPRITAVELAAELRGPTPPLVLDVRATTAPVLDPRRIPGARIATIVDVERAAAEPPWDRKIVVYCACPNDSSASRLARALTERGSTRVAVLGGGLDAWLGAGLPIETSSPPLAGSLAGPLKAADSAAGAA